MTPVPQAAVDAAMKAMHCKRAWRGTYCFTHNLSTEWTEQGCGYAVSVAAAVVAAVQGPIKAEARHELIAAVYHSGRDLVHIETLQEFSDRIEAQP